MKLYKDKQNKLYGYEEDGSQDHLIGDKVQVTQEEADAIIAAAQQKRMASLPYDELRRLKYPPIGDQLDALYHAGVFPPEMAEMIKKVKEQYPKK